MSPSHRRVLLTVAAILLLWGPGLQVLGVLLRPEPVISAPRSPQAAPVGAGSTAVHGGTERATTQARKVRAAPPAHALGTRQWVYGEVWPADGGVPRRLVVRFGFGCDTLAPDVTSHLRRLSSSFPSGTVARVGGHTDAVGDNRDNDALSRRRARVVAHPFAQTPRRVRVTAVRGFGEHRPVARNRKQDGSDNPGGRERNRRVVVRLAPPGALSAGGPPGAADQRWRPVLPVLPAGPRHSCADRGGDGD